MLRRAGGAHFNSRPSARGDASCTLQIVSLTRFQFTPLREGRLSRYTFDNDLPDISIHAPPRGATMLSEQQHPLSWHFNSRPSARGDSGGGRADWRKHYFNSRPSARGDASPPDRWRSASYFNSRPSARGDAMMPFSYMNFAISIHAPPRGATLHEKRGKLSGLISIHAPPRGATMTRIGAGLWGQFQFTPLREGRRGASGKTAAGCYFNSRPSARGDCPRANCKIANRAFQFTPLREGRHVRLWERTICTGISIHAPPRGATDAKTGIVKSKDISIHAPPRGATSRFVVLDCYLCISIHAPPRGATL